MESFYEICSGRRSVRSFSEAALSEEILGGIRSFAESTEALADGIASEFEILEDAKVKGLFAIKAPYYLCLYETPAPGYLANAGYRMEQVDLYLASRGIGACWLGMAKPPRELLHRKQGKDYVIMLAFGMPAESEDLLRKSVGEFRRKSVEEIAEPALLRDPATRALLEPVRLAPSATNGQPWYFSGSPEEILVNRIKHPPIKASLYEKMNQIDIGIALCFLKQAAMHGNRGVEFFLTGRNMARSEGRNSGKEPWREAPKGFLPAAVARVLEGTEKYSSDAAKE